METVTEMWFDPSCQYSWVTADWLREVRRVRPVRLHWHVMSLAVLNEHRDDDPEGDPDGYLWHPARLFAVVAQRHGQRALADLHAAYAARVLASGDWSAIPAAVADAGLPAALVEVMTDPGYDELVRASHGQGQAAAGPGTGTPIVAATGPDGRRIAWFGPVLSRAPRGEEAGRLWDATLLVAGVPGFHELKGPPHEPPQI